MTSWQQICKECLKFSLECLKLLLVKLQKVFIWVLKKLGKLLQALIQFLNNQKLWFPLLSVTLLLVFIAYIFVPVEASFEGILTVNKLNFTANQPNKLWLESIRGITQLELGGEQTLPLTGQFFSESEPRLNQVNSLVIELLNSRSKLIIVPVNSQISSDIELTELRLLQKTDITELTYKPFNHRLLISLRPTSSQIKPTNSNFLKLVFYLGNQPLKLFLEGYRIPNLNLQDSPDVPNPLELTFTPDNSNLNLDISKPVNLSINLPNPSSVDSNHWFRDDLAIQEINFYEKSRTGIDNKDEIYSSTIVSGKIRVAEQELKVEQDRFLLVDKPGIQKLRHIEIKHPQGLEVRFAGKTKRIQVGLDSSFPVDTIQSNWLNNFLPKDYIIAIVSFCFALLGSLLVWMLDHLA